MTVSNFERYGRKKKKKKSTTQSTAASPFNDMDEASSKLQTFLRQRLQKSMEHFKGELDSIQAGRTTPDLLSKVVVDVYGASQVVPNVAQVCKYRCLMMEEAF